MINCQDIILKLIRCKVPSNTEGKGLRREGPGWKRCEAPSFTELWETLKVLEQSVKSSTSLRKDTKGKNNSFMAYRLEIIHSLGKISLTEKLFPIISF